MIQRHFHALRKIHKQNLFQFAGIDRASICRKTDKKADVDAFLCDLTGSSLQNFLSAVTDLDHTALTGAFCLVTEFCGYFRKTSEQSILQCNLAALIPIISFRKFCLAVRHKNPQRGRCCEWITLHMLDKKLVIRELICPFQPLVRRITFTVDTAKLSLKLFCHFHFRYLTI